MKKIKTDTTKTMLVISSGFILIYLIWDWDWAIYTALIISLTGILSAYLSRKVVFLWMKLSWLLSMIVPNVLLAIVFYLVLFPVSLVAKLLHSKTQLVLKNKTQSFFVDCDKEFDKGSFEKPF